jgi:uncharacterized membrane protein (UPF0182 family)
MAETIDWPPKRTPRRRGRLFLLAALVLLLISAGTALSYYVDALWFDSLGFVDVFWKTLNLQAAAFVVFSVITFLVLYGSFLAFKPANFGEGASGGTIIVNGQPVQIPVGPALRVIALGVSALAAVITGAGMMSEWPTLALAWYGRAAAGGTSVDPIFGRPLDFYLFTLPALNLISGWLMTLAVIACGIAIFFLVVGGGARALGGLTGRRGVAPAGLPWRGLSLAYAALLLMLAVRVYLGRFDNLFDDQTIFTGVNYTDAHVTLTGLLIVSLALVVGAGIAVINAVSAPRVRWLIAAAAPAAVIYVLVSLVGWYVSGFIVKPNELVRESPYIAHNIQFTRQAFGLDRITQRPFPGDAGIEAIDVANNRATLDNIRLWDWQALRDTLRQIQEIRTYYDFPDIDIDRYEIDGSVRQVMLGTRELSVEKLPESSRNWINEKLIYTHGFGVTMNPVNGFTPEGMPTFLLSNMPVQSTTPSLKVARPEVYFGELTNTDVYVKTRQKEFNFPQGDTNSVTTYEGTGGIVLGGFLRQLLIALDRGDLAKLPFSDDVQTDSRLLMRRNVKERVETLAGSFLTFDADPYMVVTDDGRLQWIMDAFTTSDTYPYSRHYRLDRTSVNYIRNSIKAVVDAYDGTTTFYVFDPEDPIIAAYRGIFPTLFKDASAMPPALRRHVRYPELELELQAAVFGLYHMTDPGVFYNREDLWTVATEVRAQRGAEQAQAMLPNFVLMTLPGETGVEFVEILPFTPSNRNNLIAWIAGRSDGDKYGTLVAYNFPKNRLVDGPLQVEARIDQNPQLSGQFSLWNQQGSRVVRGSLLVIPIGRGLLYAEPIYLQAERSPMPELRLVVLATQDRLAYGPTFEAAMAGLFGQSVPPLQAPAAAGQARAETAAAPRGAATPAPAPEPASADGLIRDAARDLAEYQRLTAEGKLGEAGQHLESLKQKLDQLQRVQRK